MDFKTILSTEETLDPQNWDDMRTIGYKMVDDMMDFLEHIREEPVWREPTNAVISAANKPLPREKEELTSIYDDFKQNVLPYSKGNIHPRFWAFVQGTGTPTAALADMLASTLNSNCTIGNHAAMYIDKQVIEWCKEMLGFPKTGSGMLVSGGSIANITSLIVARNSFGQKAVRTEGVHAEEKQMVMYASTETHSCLQKAAEVIGIGSKGVRKVRVMDDYRMDITHLEQLIAEDKAAGYAPFCIVGNAGTVNTGAIDPLNDILKICKRENLWFHIDGAFGALAKLVPEYQSQLKALEEADSVAFDLHKWLYLPYEVGCFLIKDPVLHRAAFGIEAPYLVKHERGIASGPDPISNYGMELSRGFKALKVWMVFREHGIDKFARLIKQNIAQCFYLEHLIKNTPELELLTPVLMNVVCFRFNPRSLNGSLDTQLLNNMNKNILMRLHTEGVAAPSFTMLHGQYAIRVANVNHRSRKEDFDILVNAVLRIGNEEVLPIGNWR